MFYSFIQTKPYVYLNHSQGWWGGGQAPAGGIISTQTSGGACPGEEQLRLDHIYQWEAWSSSTGVCSPHQPTHLWRLESWLPPSLEIPSWNTELHIPHPQPWTHSNLPTAIQFRAYFKSHLPTCKAVCGLAASYLNEFVSPHHLTQSLYLKLDVKPSFLIRL